MAPVIFASENYGQRPLADGTAAIQLEPVAFLRRLASLVPPPGSHDTAYFGVFASHSAHRRRFVHARRSDGTHCPGHPGLGVPDEPLVTLPADAGPLDDEASPGERYVRWAELMRKSWGVEVLDCPCGGKRTFVEEVCAPERIRQELQRLGLWREPAAVAKARRSPSAPLLDRHSNGDGVDPPAPDYAAS